MNCFIDIRGMAADESWLIIQENLADAENDCMTTVTDSLDKAYRIQKLAMVSGIKTHLEKFGGDYFIHINSTRLQEGDKDPLPRNAVVVITGCTFGRGDETLGKALMKGYLCQIKHIKPYPRAIIFINSGVLLTTEGSEVLDYLHALVKKGVEIISSDTCLDYYGLKSKLAVGVTAGMKLITEKMQLGENTLVI